MVGRTHTEMAKIVELDGHKLLAEVHAATRTISYLLFARSDYAAKHD